jgi:hypothetical protein
VIVSEVEAEVEAEVEVEGDLGKKLVAVTFRIIRVVRVNRINEIMSCETMIRGFIMMSCGDVNIVLRKRCDS